MNNRFGALKLSPHIFPIFNSLNMKCDVRCWIVLSLIVGFLIIGLSTKFVFAESGGDEIGGNGIRGKNVTENVIEKVDELSKVVSESYDEVAYRVLQAFLSPLALRISTGICLFISGILVFRTRNIYGGLLFFKLAWFIAYILPLIAKKYYEYNGG